MFVELIEKYLGFDNGITGSTIYGVNVVGELAISSGVYFMSDGYVGQGLCLNGLDQWLELGIHDDNCFGNVSLCNHGFSFALWIKFGAKSGDDTNCHFVFSSGYKKLPNTYSLCKKDGKLRMTVNTQTRRYESHVFPVENHMWYHVGVTWECVIGLTVITDGAPLEAAVVNNQPRLTADGVVQVTLRKTPGK